MLIRIAMSLLVSLQATSGPINPIGEPIDPDNDCAIKVDGGRVSIVTSDAPHDYAAELKQWNAPRVLAKHDGDFTVEVKVSGTFAPENVGTIAKRTPYNGAGILVVADEQNHLSLQRAALFSKGHVRHYLNFELRKDGKLSTSRWQMELNDADTWLRLARRGNQFIASASQDGKTWHSYKPIEADLAEQLRVGVEAVNATDKEFHCAFEGFKISNQVKADSRQNDQPAK